MGRAFSLQPAFSRLLDPALFEQARRKQSRGAARGIHVGEIERLSIQDGLPVLAEVTKKKVKFNRDH